MLELKERDCEQMRRENALLQSWLHRKKVADIDNYLNDIEPSSGLNVTYKHILSYNVKYEIASEELE